MNVTYISILNAIESFASEHLEIKRFASDFPEQMPNFGTEKETYPILFVSPSTVTFNEYTNTFNLTVYSFDIIQKDRSNINTILSVTNNILHDLFLWFSDGDIYGIDLIETQPNVLPINNALLDYAAGWQMDITLEVNPSNICEIPFNNAPVVITEVCDVVYSQYLTCETLEDCPVIMDIQALLPTQDQKDAMDAANAPDAANPFATLADITGGGESLAGTLAIGNTTGNNNIVMSDTGSGDALITSSSGNNFIRMGDVANLDDPLEVVADLIAYIRTFANDSVLSVRAGQNRWSDTSAVGAISLLTNTAILDMSDSTGVALTSSNPLLINFDDGMNIGFFRTESTSSIVYHTLQTTVSSPIYQWSSDSGAFGQSYFYGDTAESYMGYGNNNYFKISATDAQMLTSDGEVYINVASASVTHGTLIALNAPSLASTALAGTGTEMVVADASGVLSRQSIPSTPTWASVLSTGNTSGGTNVLLNGGSNMGINYATPTNWMTMAMDDFKGIAFTKTGDSFEERYKIVMGDGAVHGGRTWINGSLFFISINDDFTFSPDGRDGFRVNTINAADHSSVSILGYTSDNTRYAVKVKDSSGNILHSIRNDNETTFSTLAGSGTRMVVADASGIISTQAIPSTPTLQTVTTAGNTTTTDIEITTAGGALILKSPDGTRWEVTVDNSGNLTTTLA